MPLDQDLAKDLLFRMKRIRDVEERIAHKYHEGKMRCPTHLSIGQEAVAVVVGLLLRDDDFAVSTHRAHAHYLGKGGNLNSFIAEIYGKKTGCSGGRGGSMHLIDIDVGFMGSTAIVANSIPVGVGLGLSIQLNETDQISCVFLGDGAVEEGAFYEAANFAAVKNLPILFVCENNLYSVYSSLSVRQPDKRNIHEMVEGFGITSVSGDGNDVTEVYSLLTTAIDSVRGGKGPYFVELSTYRWREHCGPNYDNDIGYRTEEEFIAWKKRDPIELLYKKLESGSNNLYDEYALKVQEINKEIDEAFQLAEEAAFPDTNDLLQGVYK